MTAPIDPLAIELDQFAKFAVTRDPILRDALVLANLRLALKLGRRFSNRGIAADDLDQVAALGLLKAVDRFDPARGMAFVAFATPTILGELKRHFRDKGWTVRVPRRVQELHLQLNLAVPQLTQQLGRSPTIEELARATRATTEEVLEAMEAAQAYSPAPIEGIDLASTSDEAFIEAENRVVIEALLADLAPRDQMLMRLRFFQEMSQQQIAVRLGMSQMQVSRLLTHCIADLREKLAQRQR